MSQTLSVGRFMRSLGEYDSLDSAVELAKRGEVSDFRVADGLRRLNLLLDAEGYRDLFFEVVDPEQLASYFASADERFEAIVNAGFLPMPGLLELISGLNLADSVQLLRKRRDNIEAEGFNIEDRVDLEIEFSRYRIHGDSSYTNFLSSFEDFKALPVLGDINIPQVWETYMNRTAAEAVGVYKLVEEWHNPEKETLVIGNLRYGGLWVVNLIEDELKGLGVDVGYDHVSSYGFDIGLDQGMNFKILSRIRNTRPDVIVVDGTSRDKECSGDNTYSRLPSAMLVFIENLTATGLGYEVEVWHANQEEDNLKEENSDNACDPRLLMVSAASTSNAHFDDIDSMLDTPVMGFTSYGLDEGVVAHDEGALVSYLQGVIKEKVHKLLHVAPVL